MGRIPAILLFFSAVVLGIVLLARSGSAETFKFGKIVGRDRLVPGAEVSFESFGPPSIHGTDVAFKAVSLDWRHGIYKADLAGNLVVAVDETFVQPQGTGSRFTTFGADMDFPSIYLGTILFKGSGDERTGIYKRKLSGSVTKVVDDRYQFPDQDGYLVEFDMPSRGPRTVISARDPSRWPVVAGIYSTWPAGPLLIVADTRIPDEGSAFFDVGMGVLGGGVYAYRARYGTMGPYSLFKAPINASGTAPHELIARSYTVMPNDTGVFGFIGYPQIDRVTGIDVCFFSQNSSDTVEGIYKGDGTSVAVVADTTTPIPSGNGNFTRFDVNSSIHGGDIVFHGYGERPFEGIYLAKESGTILKVIDTTDLLDESPVFKFQISREAVCNGRIAFLVIGESVRGIYYADYGPVGTHIIGFTRANPILPVVVTPGNFRFENAPTGMWLDPPMADGFEYVMTSDSLFMAILEFPPGFGDSLSVTAEGVDLGTFKGGQGIDFTDALGHGVARFTVRGITPVVDGEDPAAFPLRLAFDTETANLEMTAIEASGNGGAETTTDLAGSAKLRIGKFAKDQGGASFRLKITGGTWTATDGEGRTYTGAAVPLGKKGRKFRLDLDAGSVGVLLAAVAEWATEVAGTDCSLELKKDPKLVLKLVKKGTMAKLKVKVSIKGSTADRSANGKYLLKLTGDVSGAE